jgi:DNA-binding PadR family transcriptional regulator
VEAGVPKAKSLEPFLPLRPKTFHILLALASEPANGYQIANDVHDQTDGVVRVGPGTLYETLHRLLEQDLIEETMPRGQTTDRRGQRFYRLTPLGRRTLRADAQRLSSSLRLARALGVAGADR